MKLSPHLFWDIDLKDLNFEKHARFIIERVLTRGRLSDWFEIQSYYGWERLKKEVLKIRSMDSLTLNFCSKLFHIPKEQFRCYTTEPSIRKLWNY
ncbi:MAG: hypothetical protein KDE33_25750 [Bacteroidetes bacterium]|nr:hypothetical protein [Bacteroidota bacterium]